MKQGLQALLGLLIGVAFGMFMVRFISLEDGFIGLFLAILYMILSIYLHIIFHEAGHMVCGILSGYSFLSFRIGSFMILKKEGKIEFKKMKLAGTAGQCILCPPDIVDGTFPFVFYNLGGVIVNFVLSILAIGLYILFKNTFWLLFALIGIFMGLMNGIPYNTGDITNDGMNVLLLMKDRNAAMAFWKQLKINELQTKGLRLKDIDPSLFEIEGDTHNILISTILVFQENQYMDLHDFDKARESIEYLLSNSCKIIGLYKNLLQGDLYYLDVLSGKEVKVSKAYKKYAKTMKNFPSIIRTEYALTKDEKVLERFEKVARTYPVQADIEMERELIELIKADV